MKLQPLRCGMFVLLFAVYSLSQSALGHHSFAAHYDASKAIEVKGVVSKFSFRSPHSFVFIDGENPAGESVSWEVELHSKPTLLRLGLSQDSITAGDPITVIAWPNRNPENPLVFGIGIITKDGVRIGERRPIEDVESVFVDATAAARIQGRWQVDFKPPSGDNRLPLNTAGHAVMESYDAQKSPANTCEIVNIPSHFHLPYLYDIRINDKEVVIHYELFNISRVVTLGDDFMQSEPTGMLGEARARIEGDELVVETRNYPESGWGLAQAGDLNGVGADIPSSGQKRMVERYSVSADGLTLNVDYKLEDAVYLAETFVASAAANRVSDDEPIYEYTCEIDSATRFSRDPE